eukprot:m.309087 g.309087  ORF g.309087 m.309087 type:complete len:138 (+) comp45473_c0_seq1:223-636(+)
MNASSKSFISVEGSLLNVHLEGSTYEAKLNGDPQLDSAKFYVRVHEATAVWLVTIESVAFPGVFLSCNSRCQATFQRAKKSPVFRIRTEMSSKGIRKVKLFPQGSSRPVTIVNSTTVQFIGNNVSNILTIPKHNRFL